MEQLNRKSTQEMTA